MKNLSFVFFFLFMLTCYVGFTQAVHQTYSTKFDTVGFTPPSFPGGYDSVFSYIQKNVILNDSNRLSGGALYDALITFTITPTGTITNYKHKGSKVGGIESALQNCITKAKWTSGKSQVVKKLIESAVQINFTYNIQGNSIKYVQKSPIYVFNYDKKPKISRKIIVAFSIFFTAITVGFIVYTLV